MAARKTSAVVIRVTDAKRHADERAVAGAVVERFRCGSVAPSRPFNFGAIDDYGGREERGRERVNRARVSGSPSYTVWNKCIRMRFAGIEKDEMRVGTYRCSFIAEESRICKILFEEGYYLVAK